MLLTLFLIIEVGVITNNVFGKRITTYIGKLFIKLPVMKTIYNTNPFDWCYNFINNRI